jgi:hypothetical protein
MIAYRPNWSGVCVVVMPCGAVIAIRVSLRITAACKNYVTMQRQTEYLFFTRAYKVNGVGDMPWL